MATLDKRLIEDYLPIEKISAESRREKSLRQGHISTLHLWWARRPLVASRAAVFGALVPAKSVDEKFVAELCLYPGHPEQIKQAQRVILQAHAERLTAERGELVTVEDIEAGRAPRPRVLDMFAGGGAIPLEALRLGCESYALDLNPVAHLIQLCTLVYPQKYGQPDPAAKGSAKDGTWAGLADEVEYWGKWVLERVKKEIGDLYPPIPVATKSEPSSTSKHKQLRMHAMDAHSADDNAEMLTPVAYLWTRTVKCKNPTCGATVPLVRQTWLAKKTNRYIALKMIAGRGEKQVRFKVVEATTEEGFGFDPSDFSKSGNATCLFCGTVADSVHVKAEGKAGRIGRQGMAVVCAQSTVSGKVYISADDLNSFLLPDDNTINVRIEKLCAETGLTVPSEEIVGKSADQVPNYGMSKYSDLFPPRQLLVLLTFAKYIRQAVVRTKDQGLDTEHTKVVLTYLGVALDRVVNYFTSLCVWRSNRTCVLPTFSRQALAMVWDFGEMNPFAGSAGDWLESIDWVTDVIHSNETIEQTGAVNRGSATEIPYPDNFLDAMITDPPYYDNVIYADLADFFYVWLKRTVGYLYAEHFSTESTPKKNEAVSSPYRYANKSDAKVFYEQMMAKAFREAYRVLKKNAPLVIVYAHKTTSGWATLVNALKDTGFMVTESWPLDTEMEGGMRSDTSSLASSIFLVTRRREGNETGSYEKDVQSDLQAIVKERVETLWSKGVTGADLVIACVGAGLRAFTRYARVEYANGEEVPADKFLAEVEGAVLETLLEKLFGLPRSGVSVVDAATRFYVLWRYAYRNAEIDAGEAIIFALPQGVELDGPRGLSHGVRALIEKSKTNYRLRDYTERGDDDKLGLPQEGATAPLIDILHRVLWLMENQPAQIADFIGNAQPNIDHLRVVAETLAGAKLAGNGKAGGRSLVAARGAEAAALRTLTTNWRTVIEANAKPI